MRNMVIDEDKVFDACTAVEEIIKILTSTGCTYVKVIPSVVDNAKKAARLLNQAMEEGELL